MKARLRQFVTSVETWAAASDGREQLLVGLILLAFALLAILVIAVVALVMLPPQAWSL